MKDESVAIQAKYWPTTEHLALTGANPSQTAANLSPTAANISLTRANSSLTI
jgi:hypothetical protein